MTKEQKAWFKKLQKHIEAMPDNTEVSVCAMSNSSSLVHLHNLGDVCAYEEINGDRLSSDYSAIELDSFYAENVIPNSECF